MKITRYVSRDMQENCYVLEDEKKRECAIIDPGFITDGLLDHVKWLKVKYILLTHGHFDHISGVEKIRTIIPVPVAVHKDDVEMVKDPVLNLSTHMGMDISIKPDMVFEGGERVDVGGFNIEIIHVPGHTPGSVCYVCNDIIFSGDTIFSNSVGRTDFVGGDVHKLKDSVDMLVELYPDASIYPGHGESGCMKEFTKCWKVLKLKL